MADTTVTIARRYLQEASLAAPPHFKVSPSNIKKITIHCHSTDDKKKVINVLNAHSIIHHTFTESEDKPSIFVLKGYDSDSLLDIKTELKTAGLEPSAVSFLYKAPEGSDRAPLLLVHFQKDSTSLQVLKLKFRVVNYVQVQWEHFDHTKRRITQCRRCQAWGHSDTNCMRPIRCGKCAESHSSSECTRPNRSTEIPPKCANCKGEHVARFTGCPSFTKFVNSKNAATRRRRPAEIPAPGGRRDNQFLSTGFAKDFPKLVESQHVRGNIQSPHYKE